MTRIVSGPDCCKALNDAHWFNWPKPYSPQDYEDALHLIVEEITSLANIGAIYQIGGVSVPGISDIDLVVVLDAPRDAGALNDLPSRWLRLDNRARDILFHMPLLVLGPHDWCFSPQLFPIFSYRLVYGRDYRQQVTNVEQVRRSQLLALAEIASLLFLRDLAHALLSGSIDVRLTLLRTNALRYAVEIVSHWTGPEPHWTKYLSAVDHLRRSWFHLSKDEIKERLLASMAEGVELELDLIERIKRILDQIVLDQPLSGEPLGTARGQEEILGTLDNCVFFLSDWSREKCIQRACKLYPDTRRFVSLMPSQFLDVFIHFHQSGGLLSKCMEGRLSYESIPARHSSDCIAARARLIESHLSFLHSAGLVWGALPYWGFNPAFPAARSPWQERAVTLHGDPLVAAFRCYFQDEHTLTALAAQVDEGNQQVAALTASRALCDQQIAALQVQVSERDQQIAALREQVVAVHSSLGWNLLQAIWRMGSWAAPRGTLRYRSLHLLLRTLWALRTQGLQGLVQHSSANSKWRSPAELADQGQNGHLGSRDQLSKELKAIVQEHSSALDVVIFLPSVEWNITLFQRPHQLALALARQGCLVFFCQPPHSTHCSTGFHKVTERLFLAKAPLDLFREVDSPVVFALVYNAHYLSHLGPVRVIYEYIDELDVFPGEKDVKERNHRELLETATHVVATAERLYQKVCQLRPDAMLCPNGVDYDFIRRTVDTTTRPPSDLQPLLKQGSYTVGYYGALAEWFDYDLVVKAASEHPSCHFVLIGPDYDGSIKRSRIDRRANIHWLGPRPYAELPHYLKYFDVATIPFRLNEITHSTSPLKLFEYMAGGKPTVTTAMRECQRYPGVLIAHDALDFVDKLDEALELRNAPEYLAVIDRVARENTWDARAAIILESTRKSYCKATSLNL